MGRVAPVQHQRVPLAVREERHVTDARVASLSVELDAGLFELRARFGDVGNAQRDVRSVRLELPADLGRIDEVEAHAPGLELGPALVEVRAVNAQRLAVEALGPLHVLYRNGDEIRPFNRDQPTEPSICSWIRRFISTAYSSGSSFVIGSTQPDTTIADASASERPRDIR